MTGRFRNGFYYHMDFDDGISYPLRYMGPPEKTGIYGTLERIKGKPVAREHIGALGLLDQPVLPPGQGYSTPPSPYYQGGEKLYFQSKRHGSCGLKRTIVCCALVVLLSALLTAAILTFLHIRSGSEDASEGRSAVNMGGLFGAGGSRSTSTTTRWSPVTFTPPSTSPRINVQNEDSTTPQPAWVFVPSSTTVSEIPIDQSTAVPNVNNDGISSEGITATSPNESDTTTTAVSSTDVPSTSPETFPVSNMTISVSSTSTEISFPSSDQMTTISSEFPVEPRDNNASEDTTENSPMTESVIVVSSTSGIDSSSAESTSTENVLSSSTSILSSTEDTFAGRSNDDNVSMPSLDFNHTLAPVQVVTSEEHVDTTTPFVTSENANDSTTSPLPVLDNSSVESSTENAVSEATQKSSSEELMSSSVSDETTTVAVQTTTNIVNEVTTEKSSSEKESSETTISHQTTVPESDITTESTTTKEKSEPVTTTANSAVTSTAVSDVTQTYTEDYSFSEVILDGSTTPAALNSDTTGGVSVNETAPEKEITIATTTQPENNTEVTTTISPEEIPVFRNVNETTSTAENATVIQNVSLATDRARNLNLSDPSIFNETFVNTSTTETPCLHNQFMCDVGTCRNMSLRCDGFPDCADGTDEVNCTQINCGENFMCASTNSCIMAKAECDGVFDCFQGEDETHCKSIVPTCAESYVMCPDNSTCIAPLSFCDGIYNCLDRSDETNCEESHQCEAKQDFYCSAKLCIDGALRCDGSADCNEGEDEQNCSCRDDQYQCSNGFCVDSKSGASPRCDGVSDCKDGSDEIGCVRTDELGVVQAYDSVQKAWTLICGDNWSSDNVEADAVCQQFGYAKCESWKHVEVVKNATFNWTTWNPANYTAAYWSKNLVRNVSTECHNGAVAVSCKKHECAVQSDDILRSRRDTSTVQQGRSWPYVTLLFAVNETKACHAQIINSLFVLTTASCLKSLHAKSVSDLSVHANVLENRTIYKVQQTIYHPHFSQFRSKILPDFDLAMIRLENPLEMSKRVAPICLGEDDASAKKITCFVGTFGEDKPRADNFTVSSSLSRIPLVIMERSVCNQEKHYSGQISPQMICANESETQRHLCENDLGAPIMCLSPNNIWRLAGLLSYQHHCGRYATQPVVFANTHAMRGFIETVTSSNRFNVPRNMSIYVLPSEVINQTTGSDFYSNSLGDIASSPVPEVQSPSSIPSVESSSDESFTSKPTVPSSTSDMILQENASSMEVAASTVPSVTPTQSASMVTASTAPQEVYSGTEMPSTEMPDTETTKLPLVYTGNKARQADIETVSNEPLKTDVESRQEIDVYSPPNTEVSTTPNVNIQDVTPLVQNASSTSVMPDVSITSTEAALQTSDAATTPAEAVTTAESVVSSGTSTTPAAAVSNIPLKVADEVIDVHHFNHVVEEDDVEAEYKMKQTASNLTINTANVNTTENKTTAGETSSQSATSDVKLPDVEPSSNNDTTNAQVATTTVMDVTISTTVPSDIIPNDSTTSENVTTMSSDTVNSTVA